MIACVFDECPRPRQDRQIDKWRGKEKERRERGKEGGRETYSSYKDMADMGALLCDHNTQEAKGRIIYKKNPIEQKMWQLTIKYM